MHPSIGQLNGGKFYSYLDGYHADPFIGSLEQVEVALGIRSHPTPSPVEPVAAKRKCFNVTLRFQYPAWDEIDGIVYRAIEADSRTEANALARRMADQDGHLGGAKGRVTFSACEQ